MYSRDQANYGTAFHDCSYCHSKIIFKIIAAPPSRAAPPVNGCRPLISPKGRKKIFHHISNMERKSSTQRERFFYTFTRQLSRQPRFWLWQFFWSNYSQFAKNGIKIVWFLKYVRKRFFEQDFFLKRNWNFFKIGCGNFAVEFVSNDIIS